jgi:hypothetical protein
MLQQNAAPPSVLGGDDIHRPQNVGGAGGQVSEVSEGGGDNVECSGDYQVRLQGKCE